MTTAFTTRRRLVAGMAASTALFHVPRTRAATDDIVIGQSAPLSGLMGSAFKEGALDGQTLGFDDINRRGGISGRQIRHVVLDDAFDPKRTLDNARTLVEKEGAHGRILHFRHFLLLFPAQTHKVTPGRG